MSDSDLVRAVTSWAIGFVVLIVGGVGIPVLASLVPDFIAYGRRQGRWQPLALLAALILGLIALVLYQCIHVGAPGSPSLTVWASLTILLAVATTIIAGGNALLRAWARRTKRRGALALAMRPPVDPPQPQMPPLASRLQPPSGCPLERQST